MSDRLDFLIGWHAEDAAILWIQRQIAVHATHYRLEDLSVHDSRIDAHLDGLVVHGLEGWEVARHALSWGEAGEVFTAAALALLTEPHLLEHVVELVRRQPDLESTLAEALCWPTAPSVPRVMDDFSMSEDHVLARVGLRAQIASRRAAARRLLEAAEGADPGGQQVALLGLGEMGIADAVPYLRMRLGDEDATIRASAAWSLVRLARDAAACRSLQDAVESAEPCGGLAADWIARCLAPPEACRWIDQLASREPLVPRAIQAAAALGDPARLDWLVACMSSTPLARQAGEAFGQITGLDLAQAGFESPPPPGFDTLPNEDPTDDRVALDPWERYPWPDVPRVASWLADHRSAWQEGERYFLGQRLEREVLARTLRWGTQFQRGAAARELAVQDPGVPYFNVASHAHVQRQRLSLPRHHRAS